MGQRRLRRHRHHAADRRRVALPKPLDVRADERVLDVAAGNGNATLAAARRFADVTSTDYVPALLDTRPRARARPKACRSQFRGGRRREPAVRRRQLRRRAVDVRRDVRARPRAHGPRDAARAAQPAAASAWRTGRRTASSAGCSRSSARTCRRRPACSRRRCGAREAHLADALRRQAAQIRVRAAASSTSATAPPRTGCRCSATSTARRTRRSPRSTRPGSAVAGARDHRAARRDERRRPGVAGRAGRVPRSRHHQALNPDRRGVWRPGTGKERS